MVDEVLLSKSCPKLDRSAPENQPILARAFGDLAKAFQDPDAEHLTSVGGSGVTLGSTRPLNASRSTFEKNKWRLEASQENGEIPDRKGKSHGALSIPKGIEDTDDMVGLRPCRVSEDTEVHYWRSHHAG